MANTDEIYPREFDIQEVTYFKLEGRALEAAAALEKGETTKIMAFVNGRTASNRPLKVVLDCEALGSIIAGDYGQTVLCRLLDAEDVEGIAKLEEQIIELIPDQLEYKSFLQDDKFFLKLAVKDDRYKFELDPESKPSQHEKSPFHQNSTVQIVCQPNVWINYETKKSGIFLNVFKIVVDGGKKKSTSRKR